MTNDNDDDDDDSIVVEYWFSINSTYIFTEKNTR